ncbi:hypothetical protein ACSBR2_042894 [Camellia fascicularis]
MNRFNTDSESCLALIRFRILLAESSNHDFSIEKSIMMTLSGVLNFMDALVSSCCGDEGVMVFTLNNKEHINSSILRTGRIDVYVHFPLCNFNFFKSLTNNYLGLKDHKLFPQVEEVFQGLATLSATEIGEIMIANKNSSSRALRSMIGRASSPFSLIDVHSL